MNMLRNHSSSTIASRWRAGVTVIGLMLMALANTVLAQTAWPTIALPSEASAFDIGKQVNVNGLPMRMRGFVSALKPAQLTAWFRQHMGKPLVENRLADKLILGRVQDEYYLTVQLEPVGSARLGVATLTHLKTAYDTRADNRANTEHWLSRLPAGSK